MARAMKDSGVEWLGNIPETWKMVRVKNIFSNHKSIVGDKEAEYERLSLTLNGVLKRQKDDSKGLQSESLSTYQILSEKELVFKMIDLENVNTSRVGYSPYTGIVSPVYIILNNEKYTKYGYYYFYNMWQRAIFNQIGNNGVRSALNASDMLNLPFPIISQEEAEKIAKFLDEKISEIDAIIDKTKVSIGEYKKYKQAVITEAVTKGLDTSVPMKDSEVEWIGSIPKKWNIWRLKYLLKEPMKYGANESGIPFEEMLPRYIRITDITSDNRLKDTGKLSLTEYMASGYILNDGDILFARSGGTVGKSFIYKAEYGRCAFAGYLIKATIDKYVLPQFAYYYTLTSSYDSWKNRIFIQSTIQNIGADKYSNMEMVVPNTIEEQVEIIKYLDVRCAEIDALIAKKEAFVEEMEAYKKSLIYEYVTGKKEVL